MRSKYPGHYWGQYGTSAKQKPGRKSQKLAFHMFLLAKKTDFLPPTSELNRLTRNGLGSPVHELPGLTETVLKKSEFDLTKSLTDFEDYVISSYPDVSLGRTGFDVARVNEGKRLEVFNPRSLHELKIILRKGKLWIIPKRKIHLPLSNINSESASGSSANNYQEQLLNVGTDIEIDASSEDSGSELPRLTHSPVSQLQNRDIESRTREPSPGPSTQNERPVRRRIPTTRRAAERCRNTIHNYATTIQRRIAPTRTETATQVQVVTERYWFAKKAA